MMSRTRERCEGAIFELRLAYGPVTLHSDELLVFAATVAPIANHIKPRHPDQAPVLIARPNPAVCR